MARSIEECSRLIVGKHKVSPAIGEFALQERPQLLKRIKELEAEVAGLRSFKSSVDEALNSGDGSYQP